MEKIRKIFKESLNNTHNAFVEFTYPQFIQKDIDNLFKKFSEMLSKIDVKYCHNYDSINKIVVVCGEDKLNDVKDIAKYLGLTLQNELKADPKETNKL
jgi:hypothetical protein